MAPWNAARDSSRQLALPRKLSALRRGSSLLASYVCRRITATFTGPRQTSLLPKAARPAAPCATYCYHAFFLVAEAPSDNPPNIAVMIAVRVIIATVSIIPPCMSIEYGGVLSGGLRKHISSHVSIRSGYGYASGNGPEPVSADLRRIKAKFA